MKAEPDRRDDMALLIAHDRPELYLDLIEAQFPKLRITLCRTPEAMTAALQTARPTVVFSIRSPSLPGPAHRALLDCPSLRWVQVGGAGVDHLLPWDRSRITVTNCAGVLSRFMAEYVISAILMANLGFPRYARQQAQRRWQSHPWTSVGDQSVLIVGLGQIGRETARLAEAVGLRVLGIRRRPEPGADHQASPDRLHEALGEADFVVLHVPLTAQTRNLIGAAELARMKPTALLINTSRGAVVDQAALVEALEAGRIAGAVLDVFEHEPLPPDSPLWGLENVVVTPHMSDSVADWQRRFAEFFCDNLKRLLAGTPLENRIDPD